MTNSVIVETTDPEYRFVISKDTSEWYEGCPVVSLQWLGRNLFGKPKWYGHRTYRVTEALSPNADIKELVEDMMTSTWAAVQMEKDSAQRLDDYWANLETVHVDYVVPAQKALESGRKG